MKRRLTDTQLRDLVRARLTKGDAFRLTTIPYACRQNEVKQQLEAMNRETLFETYAPYLYDVKR